MADHSVYSIIPLSILRHPSRNFYRGGGGGVKSVKFGLDPRHHSFWATLISIQSKVSNILNAFSRQQIQELLTFKNGPFSIKRIFYSMSPDIITANQGCARDREEIERLTSRDREVGFTSRDETETRPRRDRDETETRRWYVSRPSRDRDVKTETTTLLRTNTSDN